MAFEGGRKVLQIDKGCRDVPNEPQTPAVYATAVSQVVVDGVSSLGLVQVRQKSHLNV
jgi:hypothetical protein